MTDSPLSSVLGSMPEFVITLPKSSEKTNCPNEFPAYEKTTRKIAIIGEQPGKDELREGKPFVGASGNLLFNSLRKLGINRSDCYIGNVSSEPLPEKCKNPFELQRVKDGIARLRDDVERHQPYAILLLGNLALSAAFPGEKRKINDVAGSILQARRESFCQGRKVIPNLHPAAVLRLWNEWPRFICYLERFASECDFPEITLPTRHFTLDVPVDRAVSLLHSITETSTPVALDIEGGITGMSCVSFATSPSDAFIVPLATYNDMDKVIVLRALYKFLQSSTPKILQNSLYDNFVLAWSYKSPIRNVVFDTMLSGWEIYPELKKSLGAQVSVWTREPYYKNERTKHKVIDKGHDDENELELTTVDEDPLENVIDEQTRVPARQLHEYCCRDSACTYELYEKHSAYFNNHPLAHKHFNFNMSLLPALLYMEQRGMRYDQTRASLLLTETDGQLLRLQQAIDKHIRDKWIHYGSRGEPPTQVTPNQFAKLCEILYTKLGYPKQHPKKGREVDKTKLTSSADALLELRKKYNGKEHTILEDILQWRHHSKRAIAYRARIDSDGRIRCSYNVVGTKTGRLSCRKSPTGTGYNLTTVTKKVRHLFLPDEGFWFFQCDLSGADAWTVAAHCALCGDTTMIDDLNYGLKPAKIIVLLMRHGKQVNSWSRDRLKQESKDVKESDPTLGWQYFACKVVMHGTNYGLGKDKMSAQILKRSYKEKGETYLIAPHECQLLQDLYMSRYPGITLWHRSVERQINGQPGQFYEAQTMPCASGHLRKFFGRKDNKDTFREAYAHEPQANTTYATNFALFRLWTDPDNRPSLRANNSNVLLRQTSQFRVEPLHHVHDALCGQFRKGDEQWATDKLRQWFNNPLTIAGREITIPFEGAYGPNWEQLGEEYGGGTI